MGNKQNSSAVVFLVLILALFLIGIYVLNQKTQKSSSNLIQSSADLDEVNRELEMLNPEQLDGGITELSADSSIL